MTAERLDDRPPVPGGASLFTSVVAFGVAAFAFGIGLLMVLVGWALLSVDRTLRANLA